VNGERRAAPFGGGIIDDEMSGSAIFELVVFFLEFSGLDDWLSIDRRRVDGFERLFECSVGTILWSDGDSKRSINVHCLEELEQYVLSTRTSFADHFSKNYLGHFDKLVKTENDTKNVLGFYYSGAGSNLEWRKIGW
jgi:hypothetical protein